MIKRIPKRFYDDCVDCETLVPQIVKETKAHYFIDTSKGDSSMNTDGTSMNAEATMADFISRAKYYSDEFGFDGCSGICKSAEATLRALGVEVPAKIRKFC